MSTTPGPFLGDPFANQLELIKHRWTHVLAGGVVLILLGIAAISAACVTTLALTVTFGALLVAAGVLEIVLSGLNSRFAGFFVHLIGGILYVVAGSMMIINPVSAAAAITLIVAVSFLASGLTKIIVAIVHPSAGSSWVVLSGLVSLLLGWMIWSRWPNDSLWIIGTFVGIDLLFAGWSWVVLGLALRAHAARSVSPS